MFIQQKFWYLKTKAEEGQGLVEYALILVLVAVVVIVILSLLGPAIANIFQNIVDSLNPLPQG
jgi:pilus assembly protein Flp/PilA